MVVGGGVIGCATAYYLAREGADVTLLEREGLAGEASGAAAGMLAALSDEGERGPAFEELSRHSLALYETLLPELAATDVDVRHRRTDVLQIALTEREASDLRRRFGARAESDGYWLQGPEILDVEPQASPKALAAYVLPERQYVDPHRLTHALAEAARRLGVLIETRAPVRRFRRAGGRVWGVETPAAIHEADAVLLACGPWTAALARRLGAYVPVRPMRGQMLSLKGPPRPLRNLIWSAAAYLVPRENGQTFVGATVEDVGFRSRTTRSALRALRRGAEGLVPALAYAEQLSDWAGLRPASPDGLPIMGPLPGWENVWVSTGHFRNGILQAAASGQLVAKGILAGRPAPELAPFSPARFRD